MLNSTKVISATVFPDGKDGKPVNDFIEVPDNQTQARMVELGYKVKNKLVDKVEQSGTIKVKPILGGDSVPTHNRDQKNIEAPQED